MMGSLKCDRTCDFVSEAAALRMQPASESHNSFANISSSLPLTSSFQANSDQHHIEIHIYSAPQEGASNSPPFSHTSLVYHSFSEKMVHYFQQNKPKNSVLTVLVEVFLNLFSSFDLERSPFVM